MTEKELEKLKYPIGKYNIKDNYSAEEVRRFINVIEEFPAKLRGAVKNLNAGQLDTPYRFEGWNSRQVIHHIADSHMNAYIRIKLALTEDTPTIKPYFEDRWAKLEDYKTTPLEVSHSLIENLHKRWVILLRSIPETNLKRKFYHPEYKEETTIEQAINIYAWHCSHHLAHITGLKERMGW